MKALLIQPPVYDTQYFPDWSMPSGLLKIASWLRGEKIKAEVRLIDCLYPEPRGRVPQTMRSVVQICSTLEWPLADYREMVRERYGKPKVELPANHRYKYVWGRTLEWMKEHLTQMKEGQLSEARWLPNEVWVTSIMTYWCESTIDTLLVIKDVFPKARVRVGGIYPTLAPKHLQQALKAKGFSFEVVRGRDLTVSGGSIKNGDCIVTGEIPDASNEDLDFEAYLEMTRRQEGAERRPDYAILTTSRGCPFDCSYCAQKAYNEGSLKVRIRPVERTIEEIRTKYRKYGIHRIAFYEDNFLLEKPNIEALLRRLIELKGEMPHLQLHAPEGIEVRLLHDDLNFVRLMKESGFERVYLPLENMSRDVTRAWNRRHSHADLFEKAVKTCQDANFQLHSMEVNAFVLFGMPDENLADVVNTMFYASEMVGGIVPMLFTPVPGSIMFEQFEEYLLGEMGFDLQHLNGKLYPFLKYNSMRRGIRLEDYVKLESLAFRLNAKAVGSTFPLNSSNSVYRSLRKILAAREGADVTATQQDEANAAE